ncbi:hypothetical protein [Hymenobacter sp. BT190]|uniref:hypothetical protein n=1 Tax=Hymenobacter sp. BT190 TaxID=2763505 RepID=UPI0016517E20|nr:hypothetical protein [Hymenobacter sp. BT190]MBC6698195.1 hypothetical protein [Hymenobacter sp. BT190]
MFRSLFPLRRLLATSFLLVFVNVFAGQCYCASLRQAAATGAAQRELTAKAAPMQPGHACCKPAGRQSKLVTGPAAKLPYQQKHSNKRNCCQDKSAALLSSLTTPAEKQSFALAPALLLEATAFHFRPAAGHWNQASAVTLVLREHLPPKIPDIRIFIQSLTV